MRVTRRRFVQGSLTLAAGAMLLLPLGCEPVKLAHETPGPPGCGMKDPSNTAPPMLSIAQQKAYKAQGTPKEMKPNEKGGLTWIYHRSRGSVFGEEQLVETFSFDKDGLLYDQKTDVLYKVGK